MRHSAWLSTAPERPKHDKSEAPQLTRMERRRKEWANAVSGRNEDDYNPDMPPVEAAEHLLGYLFEVGPTQAAGMSSGPITHEELRAWQLNMGVELQPWECRFLRRLSCDYLVESRKAEKADCPAPWRAPDAKPEVSSTQLALRALAKL